MSTSAGPGNRETSSSGGRGPLLTLEPLVEAVRDGVEGAGWELSGLQKTTSHQFQGRWEGESTRSAYLFFHREERWESASVDVYLDETPRGLQGNLALVLDGRPLGELGPVTAALAGLAEAAAAHLPEGYRTPLTLRSRIPDHGTEAARADVEVRFKLRIPRAAMEAGSAAVSALSSATVSAFEALLGHRGLDRWLELD